MKIQLLLLLGLGVTLTVASQNFQKITLAEADSAENYYAALTPQSGKIQGVLVLINGFANAPEAVFTESRLPQLGYHNDLLTVGIGIGQKLYADSPVVGKINRILKDVKNRFAADSRRFILGGMGYGGTVALRYAEHCREAPSVFPITPAAVFGIDPIVDILGNWESCEKQIRVNTLAGVVNESKFILDLMRRENGELKDHRDHYAALSPFCQQDPAPGNERFLHDIPVRVYYEADADWYIKNRNRGLDDTDLPGASELIRRLFVGGNARAEFISASQPSYQNSGQRNPYNWNAADDRGLIEWSKKTLHFFPDYIEHPYHYTAPADWNSELLSFPLDFASSIPYHGFEDLRFSPGWGKATGGQTWAYTLLWWLEEKYEVTPQTLQRDLEAYFTGLTKRRAVADKLEGAFAARVAVRREKAVTGDLSTYSAEMDIFDAQVTHRPSKLHVKIHEKLCGNQTILLLEVAAADPGEDVWRLLDTIHGSFRCGE